MAKYKYEYRCPGCGTEIELKMRVTQKKRRCPYCALPITPEEIDRQEADRQTRAEQEYQTLQKVEMARREQQRILTRLLLVVGFFFFLAAVTVPAGLFFYGISDANKNRIKQEQRKADDEFERAVRRDIDDSVRKAKIAEQEADRVRKAHIAEQEANTRRIIAEAEAIRASQK